MTAHSPPEDPQPAGPHLDDFFAHALDGFFFITLDTPFHLEDIHDRTALLASIRARQRITRANHALLELYRVPSRLAVNGLADLLTQGITRDDEVWWQLFASGHLHVETYQNRADSTPVWIEGAYGCFYDAAARITGYSGIQRDVTERRQAERALRDADARYRSLFEQSHDAVVILSLEGNHLATNRRAAEMLGYTVEEIQRLSMPDLSAEMTESGRVLERLINGEPVPLYERLFRKKNGDIIPVEVNAELVRDSDGTPLHIQSVMRDVSERRRMENALRVSEARHRALLTAMPDLMFRMDRQGRYLDYHAASVNDLAMSPEQFLGKLIEDIMPRDLADLCLHYLEQTLQTGQEQVYEYTYSRINRDTPRWFEARMVACAPDEVLIIVRDITGRKQSEEREFALKLEKERVRLIARFIQDASHEFRTPLTILNNSLYFLNRTLADEQREYHASKGEEQIARMTRLVDMLLLMTRLDSDTHFDTVSLALNALLHDVLTATTSLVALKSLSIQTDFAADLPPVAANAEYLLHALTHLLDNAVRYTPEGGHIHLTTTLQAEQVVLQIQDTGIGMDAAMLAHIFERFWRSDDAHTTPGLGLGLPIAQKIIELHGGSINVHSIPGTGSVFTVYLPVLSDPPAST